MLNSESGERLSSPPQGKKFQKTMEIKKNVNQEYTLQKSHVGLVDKTILGFESGMAKL